MCALRLMKRWVYGNPNRISAGLYVLGPDLKARGIDQSNLIEGITVVDYDGFVKLAAESSKVQSWM